MKITEGLPGKYTAVQMHLFVLFSFQDGHFENTYYSDFIANLKKIRYATKTNKQKKNPTLLYLGSESKCDL
uniref:Uncharacterized protein n=1 Tax=Astatotilapia calliptera TaxID=8154 RepID=A0AAX7SQ81_ASTCA